MFYIRKGSLFGEVGVLDQKRVSIGGGRCFRSEKGLYWGKLVF